MTWRERAAQVIGETIDRVGLDDPDALKKALFDAYPFGKRKHYPYKVWLDEIKVQTGKKRNTGKCPVAERLTGKLFTDEQIKDER
jgi:hypothetical protein